MQTGGLRTSGGLAGGQWRLLNLVTVFIQLRCRCGAGYSIRCMVVGGVWACGCEPCTPHISCCGRRLSQMGCVSVVMHPLHSCLGWTAIIVVVVRIRQGLELWKPGQHVQGLFYVLVMLQALWITPGVSWIQHNLSSCCAICSRDPAVAGRPPLV